MGVGIQLVRHDNTHLVIDLINTHREQTNTAREPCMPASRRRHTCAASCLDPARPDASKPQWKNTRKNMGSCYQIHKSAPMTRPCTSPLCNGTFEPIPTNRQSAILNRAGFENRRRFWATCLIERENGWIHQKCHVKRHLSTDDRNGGIGKKQQQVSHPR